MLSPDDAMYTRAFHCRPMLDWRLIKVNGVMPSMTEVQRLSAEAASMSTWAMFDRNVRLQGSRTAVQSARLTLSYAQLDQRAAGLAAVLQEAGVTLGDRICILSENDPEFLVLCIAALRLGASIATLNPRLAVAELHHCISLVTPKALLVSPRQANRFDDAEALAPCVLRIGEGTQLDLRLRSDEAAPLPRLPQSAGAAEDIQFIIYTSGTTGLPKGAMISQRAMLARLMVYVLDYGVNGDDTFLAWSPLCHMASVELGFGTLLLGGKVVVIDGPDLPTICDYLETESLSNLIFFPGMVQQTIAYLRQRRPKVRQLKKFGALADLFAPADIAELTRLLNHSFTNTFGSTETGMPPLSGGQLEAGKVPVDFGKVPSSLCEICLFGDDDKEADVGAVGELGVRGPTLFSGYWGARQATQEAFRSGWYRTGDMFRQRADGKYDYVDRRKYLIKSGGENIYPAEIERVALKHPQVLDAIVVRRADSHWGEVPVLVVVARGEDRPIDELMDLYRKELAAFKRPKSIYFVDGEQIPRSNTGKIVRNLVESWVAQQETRKHC